MEEKDKELELKNNEQEIINEKKIEEEVKEELKEEFPITEPSNAAPEFSEVSEDSGESEDKKADGDEGGEPSEEVPEGDKREEVPEEKPEGEPSEEANQEEVALEETEEKEIEETTPDIDELKRQLEDLKYEKETNEAISNFQTLINTQQKEYENFQETLRQKVAEEFNKYGIPVNVDMDELREVDPAKYQILNNIITNARAIEAEVTEQLQAPIRKASDDIVFSVAGNEMKKYQLSEAQLKEAATTFVTIMNETGIKDLKDDIKAKVELAVARAKMVVQDVKEAVNATTKAVEGALESVKETVEDAKEVKEEAKEVVKEVKKNLEDFTKGVNPGTAPKGAEVTKDNVMDLYLSKTGKDRLAFFAKYQDLIMGSNKSSMPYTDNARRW